MSSLVSLPFSALISALASALVTWSFADTFRMPLASREKLTSTFGSPARALWTPLMTKLPSLLLASTCARSPS